MYPRIVLQMSLVLALAAPVAVLAQGGPAPKVGEPTIDDIYKAAHGGQLAQADTMIAQVLVAHPQSAKAHFVHAELLAKEGHIGQAKAEYTRANELAPGLPFAKPQAVAGLLEKIDASASVPAKTPDRSTPGLSSAAATTADTGGMGTPAKVGLVVLLLAAGAWMLRRLRGGGAPLPSQAMGPAPAPGYAMPSYATGPQGYAPSATAGPAYGAAAPSSGFGGGLGGALVTGAAMGLGAVAVEEAVRHFSHRDAPGSDIVSPRNEAPAFANTLGPDTGADLGGNDFGIMDDSTWDNSGSSGGGSDDSGSDW
ncbi:hypothetical protein [Variovorax ginsengisoli]|uniref:Tetratricopeptide repeat protein n=1 Tax=Variovorax ginsengisoli TaxID=363844 RepID=A0ABT9SDA3_9BURK|nr:hypothetical protein [Variovorax ginsengisoli]MDP9902335.1 hypothetical protein [Variovorax ginsengisoli]